MYDIEANVNKVCMTVLYSQIQIFS